MNQTSLSSSFDIHLLAPKSASNDNLLHKESIFRVTLLNSIRLAGIENLCYYFASFLFWVWNHNLCVVEMLISYQHGCSSQFMGTVWYVESSSLPCNNFRLHNFIWKGANRRRFRWQLRLQSSHLTNYGILNDSEFFLLRTGSRGDCGKWSSELKI